MSKSALQRMLGCADIALPQSSGYQLPASSNFPGSTASLSVRVTFSTQVTATKAASPDLDRNELFESNIIWAKGIARNIARMLPPSFDVEDLEQECLLALWRRSEIYDEAKNGSFRGYAYLWVKGAALMSCRRRHYLLATSDEIGDQMQDGAEMLDEALIIRENERRTLLRNSHRLNRLIKKLTAFPPTASLEEFLLRKVYIEGRDPKEMASFMGIEYAMIRKHLGAAIRRLRKAQA